MSAPGQGLPALEPSFEFLIATLRMQAEVHLGLLPLPGEDKPSPPNLAMSRHFIDLLAMLVGKTKGNLTLEEERLLENSLTELRFRFVMATQNPGAAAGGDAASGAGS
jgi:hypothetical protein